MIYGRKNYIIILNSLVFFLLAYFFLYVSGQLLKILAGILFDYDILWFYNRVLFVVRDSEWSHDSVKLIYGVKPIFQLISGLVFLIIYMKVRSYNGLLKMFFLWGYLIAFNLFFVSVLLGGFFNFDFGHVLNWSYVKDTGRMIYVFISFSGFLVVGLSNARSILISSNTYFNEMTESARSRFYNNQIFIPFLMGVLIIFLIQLPFRYEQNLFDLVSISGLLIILGLNRLKIRSVPELYFDEEKRIPQINRYYPLILLVIVLLYRIGLGFGVQI